MLFDAHVHLTHKEYSSYLGYLIDSMRAMGIVACSVTVDVETTLESFKLFDIHRDVVRQFVGIHPEAAAREDPERFKKIFGSHIQSIVGIGEIGLDGTYHVPYDRQKQIFGSMLALAESTGKPVSIHSRKALDDVLDMLSSYKIRGVLLHWFDGNKKQLAKAMDMGLYVSYGPALVYATDKQVLLRNTERSKFLVETDGPVSYSRCFGNTPAVPTGFLVSVIASVVRTLNIPYEEITNLLEQNSKAYLGVA